MKATNSPFDVQIQALQDVNLFAAATIGFVEAANLNEAACCRCRLL
jgi:hypothetical protein